MRRRMNRLSFKQKLSCYIIGIGLIFAILVAIGVFFYNQNALIKKEQTSLLQHIKIYQNQITTIFTFNQDIAASIATEPSIIEYLKTIKTNPNFEPYQQYDTKTNSYVEISTTAILRRLIRYNIGNNYDIIYILAPNGEALVSTDPSLLGNNYAFRNYFQKAINGTPDIYMSIGVTTQKPGYYFSYPIYDENEIIIGVAVVKQSNQYIDNIFKLHAHENDENMFLTDEFGVVFSSNNDEYNYKSLGILNENEKQTINTAKKFNNLDIQPIYPIPFSKLLTQVKEPTVINDLTDAPTINKQIIVGIPVENTNFYLIFDKSHSVFAAQSFQFSLYVSIFIVLLGLSALTTISFLINRFMQPFFELRSGMRIYSQGNHEYRFPLHGDKDISEFGVAFNDMADKNKRLYQELQSKLSKLKRTNQVLIGREKKMIEMKKIIKKINS